MPKASPIQSSFLGGEWSPFCAGRVDSERYKISLETCENYIPLLQGGLTRRPGTRFVAEAKFADKEAILVKFQFSTAQAYMLEMGDLYVRFFTNQGQVVEAARNILSISAANPAVFTMTAAHGYLDGEELFITGIGGMTQYNNRNLIIANKTADTFTLKYRNGTDYPGSGTYTSGGTTSRVYEVAHTYTEAQLPLLSFVQSADVIFIVHPSHPPRRLTRMAATNWTVTDVSFLDGPFLPANTTATTLSPSSGTSVTPNITASAAIFATTDVGRLIRVKKAIGWRWLKITAFVSSTVVTCSRNEASDIGVIAVDSWALGLWSDTTGHPSVVTFHEDRLCFAGANAAPQRFDMSVSSDYVNFATTDQAAVPAVTAANAVSRSLNSEDINTIFWLKSEERALLAGTQAGEWAIRPSISSEAIAPENVNAKQISNYGSAAIQPVLAGKSTIFIQGSSRTVREISYYFEVDGFKALDRTILADHIGGDTGFKQLCRQKEKPSIVWFTRNDGVLAGMTYEREEETIIIAWHRHVLGGQSDTAGTAPSVGWSAVIPEPEGKRDDLWMIVKRNINGATCRYIEYLTKIFEHEDKPRDAFFVDSGLTYDAPLVISGVTKASPAVVTSTAHGLIDGDVVIISGVVGMIQLNENSYVVTNKAANTFQLTAMNGTVVDSSDFDAYVSAGEARKFVTVISGLWHLEGQSVEVWGDGGIQPPVTVTNGSVTLQNRAATAQIGLGYRSRGKKLREESGAADGTSMGKNRRTNRVAFMLHRTLGFKFGTSFDSLQEISFRTNDDPDGRAPALFTGIKTETIEADMDLENNICWEQSRPAPGTILAIAPQMHTEDRG